MTRPVTRDPATGGFRSLGLHPDLLRAIGDMGFTDPTPIQEQAVPPGIEGRDLLGCAMTGSGKTAAFLLPILQRLREGAGAAGHAPGPRRGDSRGRGTGHNGNGTGPGHPGAGGRGGPRGTTRALILTPTRELAAQVDEERRALSRHARLTGAAVFGGVSPGPQEEAFRQGVDIIVATPGRLLDHMQYDYARLGGIEVLVLDEADRMLDMGFLPDIRRILGKLPRPTREAPRQTFLFSATIPKPIAELSRELLRDPVRIDVERRQAPATGITQALFPVPAKRKPDLLIELLRRGEVGNVIAFCRTKHRANRLWQKLEREGIPTARIHGNRSQSQRTKALEGFRDGRFRVLAATDIVARGIDVEALDHVVNFDVPNVAEDYIHRVGRTARAGATGEAYTFVSPDEEDDVRSIERAVGHALPRRTLDGFDYRAEEAERFEIPVGERIAAHRARRNGGRGKSGPNGTGGRGRSGTSGNGRRG
jgi:ATP-dependent RNA helicase RhlE